MEAIHIRRVTARYTDMQFQAALHSTPERELKIPSLESILGVRSRKAPNPFTPKADAALEKLALQNLEKMKKSNGG